MVAVALFAKGLAVGFAVAAPVGPVGVLCVRRTLSEGRLVGLASGLGAAVADAAYGGIAAFGVAAVSDFLLDHLDALRLIGGIFLCLLGYRSFHAPPAVAPPEDADARMSGRVPRRLARSGTLGGAFATIFLLTLTNPLTILSFAAIFAGLGLGSMGGDPLMAGLLVLGVFLGSALWWLGLAVGVGAFRRAIGETVMRRINRASGLLIGAFGLAAIYFGAARLLGV